MTDYRVYEFWYFFRNTLPEKLYSGAAKLLLNNEMKKNAKKLKKINKQGKMVNYLLSHFT